MVMRFTRSQMRRCLIVTFLVILANTSLLNLASLISSKSKENASRKRYMVIDETADGKVSPTREVVTDLPMDIEGTNGNTDVLISSYMRTGSSFVGQVLGFRRDTFYVYEPLWSLSRYGYFKGDHERCDTFNGDCRMSSYLSVAIEALQQIYNCTFYMEPAASVLSNNIKRTLAGPKWRFFKKCLGKQTASNSCLRQLADSMCRTSRHKVTKVLRLSVSNTEVMLKSNPNLKVVYLVRDPRAIINSHMRTQWSAIRRTDVDSISAAASAICGRIEDDTVAAVDLRAKYPGRLKILMYEDFANPLPKIETLYKFVNMEFTGAVMNYVVKSQEIKDEPVNGVEIKDEPMNGVEIKDEPMNGFETPGHANAALREIKGIINTLKREVSKEFRKNIDGIPERGKEEDFVYVDDIHGADTDNKRQVVGRSLMAAKMKTGIEDSSSNDINNPFTYRETLSWKHVQIIDKRCGRVYNLLGYRKYASENDLWDTSAPAVTYPHYHLV